MLSNTETCSNYYLSISKYKLAWQNEQLLMFLNIYPQKLLKLKNEQCKQRLAKEWICYKKRGLYFGCSENCVGRRKIMVSPVYFLFVDVLCLNTYAVYKANPLYNLELHGLTVHHFGIRIVALVTKTKQILVCEFQ